MARMTGGNSVMRFRSEDEVNHLLGGSVGRFGRVRSALEQKLLEYSNKIISGEASGDTGLAQARRIAAAAAEIQPSTGKR